MDRILREGKRAAAERRAFVERLQDGQLEVIANANHEVIHEPERVLPVVTPLLPQNAGLG